MNRKIWATAVLIIGFFQLYSQSNSDTTKLDELIITGSKIETIKNLIPVSVAQITKKNIEGTGQFNVLPTLNLFSPSIFVTERNLLGFGVATGGAGSISIRGVSSSPNTSVLVMLDGNPQFQGIFGHPLSDAYVASDVEKVEIIRGPASILYGSNAMAGVINIISKKQEELGTKVNFGTSYGSFNTQKYYSNIGFRNKKLGLFASINHDRTDGIRKNTDFVITNGFIKLNYTINKKFELITDFNLTKYIANDNGPLNAPKEFNIDITRGKAALLLSNKFKKSAGAVNVFYNFGNHFLSDGFISNDLNGGVLIYQTFNLIKNNSFTIGSDLKQYGGIANRGVTMNRINTVNEIAVYGYMQHRVVEKLSLNLGLRLENNSNFGNQWIPMTGATFSINKTNTLKASVSKGFRSPTIMEMYLYAPNNKLRPEIMTNYEASFLKSMFKNKLNIELTVFKLYGENTIQVVNFKRENQGSFSNEGIELSVKYFIVKGLIIHSNYSFISMEKAAVASPQQQFNFNLNYTYKRLNLNCSTQHIEKLYTRLLPESIQNYTLVNMRAALGVNKNFDVFISGNNLFDQTYEINYGYQMPGINGNIGLNAKF
jgi:outer membrane cobalamin receptor